jgi:hypothetical protein
VSGAKKVGLCLGLVVVLFSGCAERHPRPIGTTEDYLQKDAPPEPPPKDEARQIVAEVTRVGEADVTIVDQAASGAMLTINATIPAHEKMLPHHASAPDVGDGVETEQVIEWVRVRWNTETERPIDITWPERLQFAEKAPITREQALETAESLKDQWFPEVPAGMVRQPPHLLNRPVWAILWRGTIEDDILTGDQVAVQISALTGLPIMYSQRVAVQRPSPDEIELTRKEAIEAARAVLAEAGVTEAGETHLTAKLVLSAPTDPEGGPAWLLRGPVNGELLAMTVDAMSGEVLEAEDDFEFERSDEARARVLNSNGVNGVEGRSGEED